MGRGLKRRLSHLGWIAAFVSLIWIFGVVSWIANTPKHPQYTECADYNGHINCDDASRKSFWKLTTDDPVAFFTLTLAVFTAILTGVTIFQFRFVIRADKTARIAAESATESARAATATVKTMEKNAERELRAYVFIESVKLSRREDIPPDPWSIHITVRSAGGTPAYKVITKTDKAFAVPPDDEPMEFTENAVTQPKVSIAPNSILTVAIPFPEYPRSVDQWSETILEGGKRRGMIWGRIDYEDAFGKPRWVTFQMIHTGQPIHEFVFRPKGNDSN